MAASPRRGAAFAVALATLSACAAAREAKAPTRAEPPSVFLAMLDDLASYPKWRRFDRGVDRVPPTHDGLTFIHVDPMPAPGATEFAVGTRIVRVEQRDDAPWELHAMVKRGGGFNEAGAAGWEFFELTLDGDGRASMLWRGLGPPSGDGYRAPEGGALLGCNHCHAAATWNDSVLSDPLQLADLPRG